MAWLYLILAGAFEIGWLITLKYAVERPWYGPLGLVNWLFVLALAISVVSMVLLALAIHDTPTSTGIPVGTAYAVWTGIGALGVAVLGMLLFQEPRHALRLAFIGLIVVGIVGLEFTSKEAAAPRQAAPENESKTKPLDGGEQ
jgi:quaternary ammonium compound-resistance protein SugE